ncbi:hypothetical protein [Aquirufa nivalisilvae]
MRGEETWLGEKQPHFHYISSAFGIDGAEVIRQIKSKKYMLGNLPHIKLEDFGNQPKLNRTTIRHLAHCRVTWLIEHSSSIQFLCSFDSFEIQNPSLHNAQYIYTQFYDNSTT